MKNILLLLLMLPFSALAQSKTDYEQAFTRFRNYYNLNHTDSICSMFGKSDAADEECFWERANRETSSLESYGKILSGKYLGTDKTDPERVTVFKVSYSKAGTKAMSFTLLNTAPPGALVEGPYILGTFRFMTTSGEIERMMKKAR